MALLSSTINGYWLATDYDLKQFREKLLLAFIRLKSASYGLVLTNILTGLFILQLVYILPFSQVYAMSNNITTADTGYQRVQAQLSQRALTPVPKEQPKPVAPAVAAPPKVQTLQSIVSAWQASHKGEYSIVMRSLDGRTNAAYAGNTQFVSASIYKLYVAYAVYTKMAAGEMQPGTVTSTGSNVDYCLNAMIVVSDNDCAHALLNMVGPNTAEAMVHQHGFTNTFLASQTSFITTARDTAQLLTELESGTLIRADYRQSLLGHMSQQIYRSGIPAGSKGIRVADKVGYIDSYNHDAGIVYHPSGKYVLVILSSGSSYANIADLTRQINAYMSK
ncbi:MAG: hypothetical protein JWS12_876 [Candidatus Saccharibacteria bacterium]|nr:hypothetical protein [Candidatus Saccharibacteria bacterium]